MRDNQYLIHLILTGGQVRVVPNKHLGEDIFALYREACRVGGALYQGTTGYTISINDVHDLIDSLRKYGFQPNVSPQLYNAISKKNPLKTTKVALDWIQEIQARLKENNLQLRSYQEEAVRILRTNKDFLLLDKMGVGKQQPIDTPVLTPNGWEKIGSLKIGDLVIGRDGKPHTVKGIFPQGVIENFKITFSDGSSTECGDEHLWTVEYLRGGKKKAKIVVSTRQIRTGATLAPGQNGRVSRSLGLDLSKTPLKFPLLTAPVQFITKDKLTIDPYILGCLIANGGLCGSTPVLSVNKDDESEFINQLNNRGISYSGPKTYEGNCSRFRLLGFGALIRELGLNVKSGAKFIPTHYLRASVSDRIDLLRGLMDCDGHVSRENCKVSYTSTSKKLVDDITELIEQLGGQCRLNVYDRTNEEKGIEYKLSIKVPEWVGNPFSTNRKGIRYTPKSHARPTRTIKSIESVGAKESVCISIDSLDELYVTEHCIVTHNTPQSLCAIPDNAAVLIVCPAVAKDAVWAQDFEKFRPDFKRTILYGYHSFRWPKNGEVVITNYHILPEGSQIPKYEPWGIKGDRSMRLVAHRCYDIKTQELITVPYEVSPPNNLVIIADEIQNLMNLSTLRTRAFRALMNAAKKVDGYRWGLTGTELDSNPLQLWNLLQIFGLEKQAFISWSNFMRVFGGTQTGFGTKKGKDGKVRKGYGRSIEWRVPGPNDPPNKEAIEGLRRVSIKRRLEDVMSEVPPMTVKDVHVKVDEKTLRQCEKAVEELREKGLSIDQAIDICMKTANGGIPFKELAKANKMLAIAKTPIVTEFIKEYEDANEPILVFSMNVEPLETLAKLPGWKIITGKTSAKDRKQIVADFQAGKFNKLGLSIMAAGLALNLDRAAFCFAINFAYTPAANNQAWYRIRRFTQRRPQFVFRFVANHALDERKIELLDAREAIIENTTEAAAVKGTPDHLLGEQAGVIGHGVLVTDPRTYQIRAQSKRYQPRNPKEEWIAKAMREMARRDSDRATIQNARGFSKTDSGIGLNIVGQLKMGLTDKQWLVCERILKRYEGQIGTFEKSKI